MLLLIYAAAMSSLLANPVPNAANEVSDSAINSGQDAHFLNTRMLESSRIMLDNIATAIRESKWYSSLPPKVSTTDVGAMADSLISSAGKSMSGTKVVNTEGSASIASDARSLHAENTLALVTGSRVPAAEISDAGSTISVANAAGGWSTAALVGTAFGSAAVAGSVTGLALKKN